MMITAEVIMVESKGNHPVDLKGNHTQGQVNDVESKGIHPLDHEGIHTRGRDTDVDTMGTIPVDRCGEYGHPHPSRLGVG